MNHTAVIDQLPNTRTRTHARLALALAVAATLGVVSSLSAAPARTSASPARGIASSADAPAGDGLASLDDRALMSELSSRGIDNLLDHYFKANNVPADQQQAIKTLGALGELNNPASKITSYEKAKRVKAVADGIDAVLPSLTDPNSCLSLANALIENGVNRDVNNIEYWGEDPTTKAHLRPIADAVVKLMDRAASTAQKQADDLANRLKGANDPNADKWEKLDNLGHMAAYAKSMSVYFQALALPATDPTRKKICDGAIKVLSDFDSADSGVQARVHNRIAKLNMVAGDFKAAKKGFKEVFADKTEIKPEPNPFEQYEARYFTVVTDLLAKNLAEAQADMAALKTWQTQTMPNHLKALKLDKATIEANDKGVAAAGDMLQWRVHVLEGDLAKNPADKQKADAAAEAVLLQLRKDHPEFAAIIDQQLVARMPANRPIDDKTAPSLLLALLKKGMNESYKADADKPDPQVMQKGIESAQAIINRKDRAGLTAENVEEARLSIPLLLDRMGKKVEAANGYLDFANDSYKVDPKKATEALDRAGFLVFEMRKQQPAAPAGFADLYARFLPMAVNPPYGHKELAYLYAEHLRGIKNFAEALKFYRMVPKDNAAFPAAQYKMMLTLGDLLEMRQDPATHKQTVAELTTIAQEIKKIGDNPKDQFDRAKAVQATLVLADLARIEQKDPKRTLQVLEGFDELVKGLPGESELLRGALRARVAAYMSSGQTTKATQELTRFLEQAKGDEGIAMIRELLGKLDAEYIAADLNHNEEALRSIARNEASLTHYLVDWANPATQKNPAISKFYYAYAVYDARTQRLAGSLAEDKAAKEKLLKAAQARYGELLGASMHALYVQEPDVKKRIADGKGDAKDPDPAVQTGLALTDFDLGDYKAADDLLDPLINQKKLGTPQVVVTENGEEKVKDNDLYWEATYKYLKSDWEVNKGNPQIARNTAQSLKNLLIRGGIPERWQDEFEDLRKDVAPDFHPGVIAPVQNAIQPGAPAAPPATAPAASAAR